MQRIEGSDEIQASYCITSVVDALRELIENALDAEATQISIQVVWTTMSIIVQDNGIGISDLNYIGDLACTSRKGYGFRGLALVHLRQLSERMVITSRGDILVYRKEFEKHKRGRITMEPSSLKGTIVRLNGLFHLYPLQRRLMNPTRLEPKIRQMISERWLFRHDTSFKYRSERNSFELSKTKSLIDAARLLHPSKSEYESTLWHKEGLSFDGIIAIQPNEMFHQYIRIGYSFRCQRIPYQSFADI
jgi:DNA mismatch repair ATPase MutL